MDEAAEQLSRDTLQYIVNFQAKTIAMQSDRMRELVTENSRHQPDGWAHVAHDLLDYAFILGFCALVARMFGAI